VLTPAPLHPQDSCLAEAFKVRNLLSEFDTKPGAQEVALVGFREYIFSQNTGAQLFWKGSAVINF